MSLHTRLFLRVISKSRDVYALKVISLAITLATCSLIALFAIHEFGYDRHDSRYRDVFRILERNESESHNGNRLSANIPATVFTAIKSVNPFTARVKTMKGVVVNVGHQTYDDQITLAADLMLTSVLKFSVTDGDLKDFGSDARSLILSQSRALRYFGSPHAAGRELRLSTFGGTVVCRVAAVYQDFPSNVHQDFDMILHFDEANLRRLQFDPTESPVYTRLSSEDDKARFDETVAAARPSVQLKYRRQPVAEIYFGPRVRYEEARHGDLYSIVLLMALATMILVLTLANFINLTTLTLPGRSKELAVKKLAGTGQGRLFVGFAVESLTVVGFSLLLGVVMLAGAANFLNPILSMNLLDALKTFDPVFMGCLTGLALVLAGAPLALTVRFTGATPSRLLSTDTISFPRLKRTILFLQLGISMFLLMAAVVLKRQISYSLLKEPGRNHEQVVYLDYPAGMTPEQLHDLRHSWRTGNPNIEDVMATSELPDRVHSKEPGSKFYFMFVDPDFREFFNLKLLEGRWFLPNDNDATFLVNGSGRILLDGITRNYAGTFQDISREFNLPEKPTRIVASRDAVKFNYLCVRVIEVDIRQTVNYLSHFFALQGRTARVAYLDRNFEQWLNYQDRLNLLTGILAVISAVLSCFSIYGLSVSIVRDRLKEIAIYKLLGAETVDITGILVKGFVRQMLIALIVFAPFTYIVLKELLRTFVYATSMRISDPVIPVAYCLAVILLLCAVQALSLNHRDLTAALKK